VEQQLACAGITMEKYLEDEGQTRRSSRPSSSAGSATPSPRSSSRRGRQAEEFGVDQAELSEHLVRRAQQSGQDPQEFANHMFEHNHIPDLVQEILRGKALATSSRPRPSPTLGQRGRAGKLRPDGTIGEPSRRERQRGLTHATGRPPTARRGVHPAVAVRVRGRRKSAVREQGAMPRGSVRPAARVAA
jgi:trigger factor